MLTGNVLGQSMESWTELFTIVAVVLEVIVIAVYVFEHHFFSRMNIFTQTALMMVQKFINQYHRVDLILGILLTLYFTLNKSFNN